MPENEMPTAYEPRHVEERLYTWWEERGYFQPVLDPTKKPFVISIPPPNVTGELHHGHAMFVTFEDLMIRWHRMLGDATLWVPGSDHAGIATQNVVEKALEKQGIKRRQLGREEFVKRVWEWKEEYGGIITHQLRRIGASCDWERERFTLDEGLSRAVREAFVRLYEKGLIYRGAYLVNWCPGDESAISDLDSDETFSFHVFRSHLHFSPIIHGLDGVFEKIHENPSYLISIHLNKGDGGIVRQTHLKIPMSRPIKRYDFLENVMNIVRSRLGRRHSCETRKFVDQGL